MDVRTARLHSDVVACANAFEINPRFPFSVKIGLFPRSFYTVITDIIAPRRGDKGFPNRIFLEKIRYNRIGGLHFIR